METGVSSGTLFFTKKKKNDLENKKELLEKKDRQVHKEGMGDTVEAIYDQILEKQRDEKSRKNMYKIEDHSRSYLNCRNSKR